ncbi:PleD family two-component system response regulator [Planctomycetota bacterium]
MKILILDDTAITRSLLKKMLGKLGWDDVFEAGSAAAAYLLLKEHKFDLVLLDWMMPEFDGFNFLKVFRHMEATKDVPVIMITAKDKEEDLNAALAEGANAYIKKPIGFDIFKNTIEQVLAK